MQRGSPFFVAVCKPYFKYCVYQYRNPPTQPVGCVILLILYIYRMRTVLSICLVWLFGMGGFAQNTPDTLLVDFDEVDSLIESTPAVEMCLKDGEEDLRFFSKVPEKYSDFKQQFMEEAIKAIAIPAGNRFYCDISVEVDCKGRAGNYSFGIEPRNFKYSDYEVFKQLIGLINSLNGRTFKPAHYLGEDVNSKVKFRLLVKDDKLLMQ